MSRVAGSGASSRAGVNRQFLLSTVHGLKSHNRREEEKDCWRQHRLEQSLDIRLSNATGERQQKNSSTKATALQAHGSTTSDRRFWEEQKLRAMTSRTSETVALGASSSLECGRDGRMAGKRELSDNDTNDDSVRTGHREKRKHKRKRKSRDGGASTKSDAEETQHKRERKRDRDRDMDRDMDRDRDRDRERTSTRKRKKAKKRLKKNKK